MLEPAQCSCDAGSQTRAFVKTNQHSCDDRERQLLPHRPPSLGRRGVRLIVQIEPEQVPGIGDHLHRTCARLL